MEETNGYATSINGQRLNRYRAQHSNNLRLIAWVEKNYPEVSEEMYAWAETATPRFH